MVETTTQPYSMPLKNESGYVLFLPQVQSSLDLVQSPHPDPYVQGTTKLYPLGTKLMRGEQVWRYCYAGDATITIATPVEASTEIHADSSDEAAITTDAAIGDTTVYITGTSNIATSPADEINEYEDGYFFINDEAGEGQCRKIKSNAPFGASGATEFKLYEALTIALIAGTSVCGIIRNPYRMVLISTVTCAGAPLGVTTIPITANNYFWVQSGGPCAVVPKTTIDLGDPCIIGTTAGKVDDGSAATAEFIIGYPLTPGAVDGEAMLIFLTLDR